MLVLLIGFAGKIAHPKRKEGPKKGHYFAFFPLENMTEGLNNMAAVENTSEESCRPITIFCSEPNSSSAILG